MNGKGKGSKRPYIKKDWRQLKKDAPQGRIYGGGENDITWYMGDKALLDRAGKVSFTNPLGLRFAKGVMNPTVDHEHCVIESQWERDSESFIEKTSVPGIFRISLSPSLGVSTSSGSPLNVMARNLFSTLQSTLNMRLAPAIEAPDLVCYLGAVDSIDSFYSWVSRIYGTIANENVVNKYVGRALCFANHVDYDDFRAHASDIYFWLLRYRKRVNKTLLLPKGFGFAKRHYWLYANYFKDSPVDKSQMYAHVPAGFYKWDVTSYESGTALKYENLFIDENSVLSWAELEAFGEDLLQAMLTDQDANTIGGFMLRGWGTDGVVQLPEVPIDYCVEPIYSEEVLGQIHNTVCLGIRPPFQDIQDAGFRVEFDYHQEVSSDSWLYGRPSYTELGANNGTTGEPSWLADGQIHNAAALMFMPVMDSFNNEPTTEEVVVNSRNMMMGFVTVHQTSSYGEDYSWMRRCTVDSCGLDIAWNFDIITMDNNMEVVVLPLASYMGNSVAITAYGTKAAITGDRRAAAALAEITKFDWAPRVIFGTEGVDSTTQKITVHPYFDAWDYNNAAAVDADALNSMHLAALDGAFDLGMHVNGYQSLGK